MSSFSFISWIISLLCNHWAFHKKFQATLELVDKHCANHVILPDNLSQLLKHILDRHCHNLEWILYWFCSNLHLLGICDFYKEVFVTLHNHKDYLRLNRVIGYKVLFHQNHLKINCLPLHIERYLLLKFLLFFKHRTLETFLDR